MTETNDNNELKIIQTDVGAKNGQYKCSKCGSTDISLDVTKGVLVCNFCRHEFETEKVEGLIEDITNLTGEVIGSATQDIKEGTDDLITLKCSSCGAEIMINTLETTHARCHWCRSTLSINKQIANGTIPDMVLPFKVSKEEAKTKIEEFVSTRKKFACPKFKKEFTTENILGVYLPYMIVDVNSHASFKGMGEQLVSSREIEFDNNRTETRYDADLYAVECEFDLVFEGLCVEASSDKLDKKSRDKANHIINAIMPFDIENCVKWNANYLKGYSSEKRDTNIAHLNNTIDKQIKDVARFAANEILPEYDRGIQWNKEIIDVKGKQSKVVYLPVWLYSYQQIVGNQKYLHYIAVNGRTKEIIGSVPLNVKNIYKILAMIGIFFGVGMIFPGMLRPDSILSAEMCSNSMIRIAVFFTTVIIAMIFFLVVAAIGIKYNEVGERHHHESETKKTISNIKKSDKFIKHLKSLSNARMKNANNRNINETPKMFS